MAPHVGLGKWRDRGSCFTGFGRRVVVAVVDVPATASVEGGVVKPAAVEVAGDVWAGWNNSWGLLQEGHGCDCCRSFWSPDSELESTDENAVDVVDTESRWLLRPGGENMLDSTEEGELGVDSGEPTGVMGGTASAIS